MSILEDISKSIVELEGADKTKSLVEKALKQKIPVMEIINNGLKKGLDEVGKRYENNEYFLSELLYAGEIMKTQFQALTPYMEKTALEQSGSIILGTVRGDIHDIGKNIFEMLAQLSGFKIIDLGVDVDPKRFVEEAKSTRIGIIAVSTLLTSTLPEIKEILDELKKAGIRDQVKVLIGGNAVTKQFAVEVGADAAALDAIEGLEICRRWVA
jgi:methanogenic corrinoid protein MtbC1